MGIMGFGPKRGYQLRKQTVIDETNSPLAGIEIINRDKMLMKYAYHRSKKIQNEATEIDTMCRIENEAHSLREFDQKPNSIGKDYLIAFRDRKKKYIMHMKGLSEQEYDTIYKISSQQ